MILYLFYIQAHDCIESMLANDSETPVQQTSKFGHRRLVIDVSKCDIIFLRASMYQP
jgi:hypothetical protein